jgi:hypothetical protein
LSTQISSSVGFADTDILECAGFVHQTGLPLLLSGNIDKAQVLMKLQALMRPQVEVILVVEPLVLVVGRISTPLSVC